MCYDNNIKTKSIMKRLITLLLFPLLVYGGERKILFIVNPNSGTRWGDSIGHIIEGYSFPRRTSYDICYTERAGHATQIAKRAIEDGIETIVAVGGDGTVNEVGQALIGSQAALGIIPTGSGNGLANELHIPKHPIKALKVIAKGKTRLIDSLKVNQHYAFVTAGVGFDAFVADEFSRSETRGFMSYASIVIKNIGMYKPRTYSLRVDSVKSKEQALLLTFANCRQYGNDVKIAPRAKVDDGKFDLFILRPFSKWALPRLGYKLYRGKIDSSEYVEVVQGRNGLISPFNGICHIDGEPIQVEKSLKVSVVPQSLKVITKN